MPRHRRRPHADYSKGRPRSLTAAPRGVPSHRPRGLLMALALHALVAAGVLGVALQQRLTRDASSGAGTGPGVEIVYLASMPAMEAPGLLLEGPNIQPGPPVAAFSPSPAMLKFDTSKIAARRNELFPFLASRLGFLDRLRKARLAVTPRPLATTGPVLPTVATPLRLSAAELDALVDRSWSRRDRWPSLAPIVSLADTHHPNQGQLPSLVRTYVERNLLQPYLPASTPDARFWIVLGLAADHADVLRYISRYADQHPGTRTTTELLFLLDALVEASRDAFNMLTLTPLDSLESTQRFSRANFALATDLQTGWASWAGSRKIESPEDLDRRIWNLRLQILTAIVDTSLGGYGASDARFLAGRALWTSGDHEGALSWWGSLGTDERNGYAEVKGAIARAFHADGAVDEAAISRALELEQARWLRTATRRLERFGFTPTTY